MKPLTHKPVIIYLYMRKKSLKQGSSSTVYTTTASNSNNFEFKLPNLEDAREYLVVATALGSDWYKASGNKELYVEQKQLNNEGILKVSGNLNSRELLLNQYYPVLN